MVWVITSITSGICGVIIAKILTNAICQRKSCARDTCNIIGAMVCAITNVRAQMMKDTAGHLNSM